MTKSNPLHRQHRINTLRRRYGNLNDWALMRAATVEVFSGHNVADLYAEYNVNDEWTLIVYASFIACAMQDDDEEQ